MKSLIAFLASLLLFSVIANAQSPDVSKWIQKNVVDGKEITMLRVDETDFPKILGYVSDAQHQLRRLGYAYTNGKDLFEFIERDCQNIEKIDSTFPVHYYRDEAKAYQELKVEMEQKAVDKEKAKKEEEFYRILKADYAWTSSDSLKVYTKPDTKSLSIGMIFRLSYIHAYDVENQPDWVQIDFGEHSGYVLRDDIAIDWDELAPSYDDTTHLRGHQSYNFKPTAAYSAQLKKEAAEAARAEKAERAANASPGRKYYRGPKGGCYFINSKGNKQYVDHSYCR